MRCVLLCGGSGSRLRPLTNTINKNALPLGMKFLFEYPLEKVREAGIKEVCIVSSPHHMGSFIENLGSGEKLGLDITYRIQEKPEGIAHGIYQAKNFARNDDLLVVLGDNIFDFSLKNIVDYHSNRMSTNAFVVVKEVEDPNRFGVVEYNSEGKVQQIIEKPTEAPSKDAVIGIYCYPTDVFDKIEKLQPSARGEYEVTDLNNLYVKEGKLRTHKVDGFWCDAGTPESLKIAQDWAWKQQGY